MRYFYFLPGDGSFSETDTMTMAMTNSFAGNIPSSSSSSSSRASILLLSSQSPLLRRRRRRFILFYPYSSSPSRLTTCNCMSGSPSNPPDAKQKDRHRLKFLLHDALDDSGIDTTHARAAREGFCKQINSLSDIERRMSISINRGIDLARTALYVAAEDDSLVSHSSVPLPVDAFLERMDDLSIGFCPHYKAASGSSHEHFLESLEKYLVINKGFYRSNDRSLIDPRSLYLHTVLTHRSGSSMMLSLIYSEMFKMLRIWHLLDFDAEIFFPHDSESLPRLYDKQKSKETDQPHILTVQGFLEGMLRDLKGAFWPFQHDRSKNLFLRAADAANCIDRSGPGEESCFQLASAKAAQYRLDRGVWTTVRLGDMRRALSACERLILLGSDPKELRDYSILLYHCGMFELSLQYLKLYLNAKESSPIDRLRDSVSRLEEAAEEKLMIRLNLILMESSWSRPSKVRNFLGNNSEPW